MLNRLPDPRHEDVGLRQTGRHLGEHRAQEPAGSAQNQPVCAKLRAAVGIVGLDDAVREGVVLAAHPSQVQRVRLVRGELEQSAKGMK